MKKTLLVPPKHLKVLSQRWLALGLSLAISMSFLSVVYYLIKKTKNARKQTPLNIAYVIDENWQSIYSQLLINLVEEVAEKNWQKAIYLAQKIEPLPTDKQVKVALLENTLKQWNQALDYLDNIPPGSSLINHKIQKQKEYKKKRNFIHY